MFILNGDNKMKIKWTKVIIVVLYLWREIMVLHPRRKTKIRVFKLIGYVKQEDDNRYFGINLTLNLHVYGKSPKETLNKLDKLVKWYIKDAEKNKEIKKFIPRRAPFNLYLEYYKIRFIITLFHLNKSIINFIPIKIEKQLAYA